MKKYDVTLTGHYEKSITVYAESPEQAAEKVRIGSMSRFSTS